MIDLSFLTEEEQESILAVLRRDAELKKAELQRVQNLQRTSSNKERLKYMTGEWFYETKQLRHQDRIHGSDIIRVSMRHAQRPMTIQEISRSVSEKTSFVSSENKDVFVPAVLQGVLQEPGMEPREERDKRENTSPEYEPSPVLQSPTKERINPFNSDNSESFIAEEVAEAVIQSLTLDEGHKETPTIVISSPKIESQSRSLESLSSKTGEENSLDVLKRSTNQSVEDVSSLPSSSDSKQLKSFASAPLLQQDETDSDSTFETNLGLRRNTGSSMSNLSVSSGLASMSSVCSHSDHQIMSL